MIDSWVYKIVQHQEMPPTNNEAISVLSSLIQGLSNTTAITKKAASMNLQESTYKPFMYRLYYTHQSNIHILYHTKKLSYGLSQDIQVL